MLQALVKKAIHNHIDNFLLSIPLYKHNMRIFWHGLPAVDKANLKFIK